ncbi:hypothetical protein KP509_31G071300 [Ceratopteris richardii]|uniref:3-dehydroquinate synthase n=1 Tax=Ceratopteris richardii TaxID=49495 RepID=A0A8T2R0I6_CERRI|nr:hypothetical protein KP509_31G071300 [Ceratopteris richardii]
MHRDYSSRLLLLSMYWKFEFVARLDNGCCACTWKSCFFPHNLGSKNSLRRLLTIHPISSHGVVPSTCKSLVLQRRLSVFARSAINSQVADGPKVQEVQVTISGHPYPIYIGHGILSEIEILKRHIKGKSVLLITNSKVSSLYMDQIAASLDRIVDAINLEVIILPEVERSKWKENVFKVVDKAAEAKMDRTTTFIGLGGGVINDICGFSAAVYEGGVNFIQIPTTLTAQVDVAVADETGIYHLLDKQTICSYYEPECVIVDTNTLKTLPDKQLISGIAEIIKFSLVRDGIFLRWLKDNMETLLARGPNIMTYAIRRSCEIKADILSVDSQRGQIRDVLSLGRTFGHAIEITMEPREWLHGEALAVGIVMALDLAHRLDWIDDTVLIDAIVAMERAHLPTALPAYISKEILLQNLSLSNGGHPSLALPKGPAGNCVFTSSYDKEHFDAMLDFFCLGRRE